MRAIDTHVHVFDPVRFPYRPQTTYQPLPNETAPADHLIAVLDAHQVSHAIVVTPMAGYQSDNAITLDALAQHAGRLRGIAVVEADTSAAELDGLKARHIRGVRVDLIGRGTGYLAGEGRRLPAMLREQGMILQIQCEGDQLAEVSDLLESEAGTVLIDHMGRPDPKRGLGQAGFQALLALARRPQVYVKLSGPFRFSQTPSPHADIDPYVGAILQSFGPGRCVWGSDWPFIRMDRRLDYGPTLALVARWLPDVRDRQTVLWETPARLFGLTDV